MAIIGFILLGQLSAQNKPRQWDHFAIEQLDLYEQDTLKKDQDTIRRQEVVVQATLKPGSQEYIDSMKRARQLYVDSMKAAQAAFQDSLKRERQRVSDSLKLYNDSVKTALEAQRIERQRINDSIKVVQQARKDSLDAVRAYKESKAYKDSVAQVKQARADSIAKVRQYRADSLASVRAKMKDSLATARKNMQDSLAVVRKNTQDSLAAARKAYNDSIQVVIAEQKARNLALKDSIAAIRKIRTDSLAKAKEEREAATKKRIKDREKAKNAKARDKEKKEREAYTNEKMRKKRWSYLRRLYHNTTTHYNYQYNAEERLKEVENNMLKNAVNQYDSLMPLFPFNPDIDSTKYASDLDSIIRKASVGIHIHDPRSKWQDDIYYVVGKAYYYKGDYKNAAAAFKYIVASAEQEKKEKAKNKDKKAEKALGQLADEESKNFFVHNSAKNDAVMWLARTLAQDSQVSLAQTVLNMLKSSDLYKAGLDGRYAAAQSFVDLRTDNYAAAVRDLKPLYEDKGSPDWLRQRAAFLRGQLLQMEGKYAASDSAFDKVIDLKPVMEMDFYAKMYKVNNSIDAGLSDPGTLIAGLQKMGKEQKYKEYYDRIHFAQARVHEAGKDTASAIDQYKKSVAVNSKSPVQKGLAYAGMGNIFYAQNNYTAAKLSYDSALAFLTEAQAPTYAIAVQRAGALDHIAEPGGTAKYTDSLLALAALNEKEQLGIVRKYIRDEQKRLTDSFYAAKNAATTVALPAPTTLSSRKQSWYFANPSTVQQGVAAFQQKWGSRTLKDNWNRSNLGSSGGSDASDPADNMSEEDQLLATVPSEEDLMALIPKGDKAIDSANKVLEKAMYELGIGYYKHMEDIPMALNTFDDLDKKYPAHPYAAEILYYRYIIALQKNDKNTAEQYLSTLKAKHAGSDWTKMIQSASESKTQESNIVPMAEHYEEAYNALMLQDYSKVYRDAEAAPALYPKEIAGLEKKYTLLKYAAIVGQKDYRTADSLLTLFIAQNQGHETIGWATELQKYAKDQVLKEPQPAVVNNGGGPVTLPGDSSLTYSYSPNNLHYVMISTAITDHKITGVRAGLRDYNNSKANRKKLEVTISPLDAQRSIVVVQEFRNAQDAKAYAQEIGKVKELFREFAQPSEYEILIISNDNILKLYSDRDWDGYRTYYRSKY